MRAVEDFPDYTQAAAHLGISERTLTRNLKEARRLGITGEGQQPPDAFSLRKKAEMYVYEDHPDGKRVEWISTEPDREKQQALMEETLSAFMEPLRGLAKPVKAPVKTLKDIFTEYVLTDAHLGGYAWSDEAGDDWDINIADETVRAAADRLIEAAPASERCLINNPGDWFHADGNVPLTPTGKNVLDTDTRHRKVMWVGVHLLRYIAERALQKHKTVEIRNTAGNHDPHSGMVLDVAAKCFFENEPRVIVHDSPKAFWAYRFGKNLVGIAHGHAPKPKDLPKLLATDYAQEWAECDFRYCRHGHFHSQRSFEEMGVICEGFRTLAPKDAWHAASGYRSGREAVAIVLDKEFGEIERHTAGIKRIQHESKRDA